MGQTSSYKTPLALTALLMAGLPILTQLIYYVLQLCFDNPSVTNFDYDMYEYSITPFGYTISGLWILSDIVLAAMFILLIFVKGWSVCRPVSIIGVAGMALVELFWATRIVYFHFVCGQFGYGLENAAFWIVSLNTLFLLAMFVWTSRYSLALKLTITICYLVINVCFRPVVNALYDHLGFDTINFLWSYGTLALDIIYLILVIIFVAIWKPKA